MSSSSKVAPGVRPTSFLARPARLLRHSDIGLSQFLSALSDDASGDAELRLVHRSRTKELTRTPTGAETGFLSVPRRRGAFGLIGPPRSAATYEPFRTEATARSEVPHARRSQKSPVVQIEMIARRTTPRSPATSSGVPLFTTSSEAICLDSPSLVVPDQATG